MCARNSAGAGADILEITYDQLLLYQRQLNLICLKEHVEEYGGRQFLIYTAKGGMVQEEVVNPRLAEMIKSRRREWELVPGCALMYPVSIERCPQPGGQGRRVRPGYEYIYA